MLCIDGFIFTDLKKYVNDDDKEFLKAFKAENSRCQELKVFFDLSSKYEYILKPFLKKNTIDDGFNIVFTDSPNFDINVYNDCFVKLPNGNKKSKLTLYSIQLILGK